MSLLNSPFDPAREAALVTGAGNGIGRAIAQALVGEGVRTVFADVHADTRDGGGGGLAAAGAGGALGRRPRHSVPPAMHCWRTREAAVGQVTHFVHSASPPRREADHALAVSRETWQQMHAVNLDAGFHLARELARQLIAARDARLVPAADLAARRHAAQPAALFDRESGDGDAGAGTGEDASAATTSASTRWCPAPSPPAALSPIPRWQAHSARPSRRRRGPRADGARRAVEPDLGLRHRRRRSWSTAACR